MDRQSDRQTDGRTDRILITRPRLHAMQHGKNQLKMCHVDLGPDTTHWITLSSAETSLRLYSQSKTKSKSEQLKPGLRPISRLTFRLRPIFRQTIVFVYILNYRPI